MKLGELRCGGSSSRACLAHKLRLALTALAIVLGVTFISGTFVLTDTLHNTFTTLFGQYLPERRLRGPGQGGVLQGALRRRCRTASRFPSRWRRRCARFPAWTMPTASVTATPSSSLPTARRSSTGGAPTLGLSFDPDPQLSSLHLVQGSAPTSAHDVVMDAGTAQKYHFQVGQRVRVLLAGPPQTFTISGIVSSARRTIWPAPRSPPSTSRRHSGCSTAGATTTPSTSWPRRAPDKAAARSGHRHGPSARSGGGDRPDRGRRADERHQSSACPFFSTALLGLRLHLAVRRAGSPFSTRSPSPSGQRTRELALLRIVGASRRQVFRSVLAEAAMVGPGGVIGRPGARGAGRDGPGGAAEGFGITLPTGSLVFEARTVVVALVVGVGVTVVSAISPARRAVRVPPVAALADQRADEADPLRRRVDDRAYRRGRRGRAALGRPGVAGHRPGRAGRRWRLRIGVGMLAPSWPGRCPALSVARWPPCSGAPGKAGPGELDAQPAPDRPDGVGLDGGLALVSTIAVFGASLSRSATSSVDNADQRRLHHHQLERRRRRVQQVGGHLPLRASPASPQCPSVYGGQFEFRRSLSELTAVSTPIFPRRSSCRHAGGARPPWPPASCSSTPPRPRPSTCRSARWYR